MSDLRDLKDTLSAMELNLTRRENDILRNELVIPDDSGENNEEDEVASE